MTAVLSGAVIEVVTVMCGLWYGGSGVQFAADFGVPVWMQCHHGWYGIALIALGLACRRRPRFRGWVLGLGFGILASDVVHHLIAAPLLYGDMRWHWP